MDHKDYTSKQLLIWFATHSIDVAIFVYSCVSTSFLLLAGCFLSTILLFAIYREQSIDLLHLGCRKALFYFSYYTNRKQDWYAYNKQYTYQFFEKGRMQNNKVITVVNKRVHNLTQIEDKYSFKKSVVSVRHKIVVPENAKYTIEEKPEENGFHYLNINFKKGLPLKKQRVVEYSIDVSDPMNETRSMYGHTVSQLTKRLELRVIIPPELNPKHIYLSEYRDGSTKEPLRRKRLEYSQEEHMISKTIQFPRLYRSYAIEWEW